MSTQPVPRPVPGRFLFAVALAVVAAAALPVAPAVAKKHKVKHSHISISQVDVKRDYAFKHESASQVSVCAHATNQGAGASSPGAELIMALLTPNGDSEIAARHNLPQLKGATPPKKGHHGHHWSVTVCAHGTGVLNLPLGAYGTQVCFSDSHSEGRDNCHYCRGKCFFIGKRSWSGTVGGTQSSTDDNVAWQAGAVTFTFARYGPLGQFTYSINPASVNYQHTTTRSFCTSVGAGTVSATSGELRVDYVAGGYDAEGEVPSDATIPATVNCPGLSQSSDASVQSTFLDDGSALTPLPPYGGDEKLANSYHSGAGPASLNYNWNFS
jgi:hypothetical protein